MPLGSRYLSGVLSFSFVRLVQSDLILKDTEPDVIMMLWGAKAKRKVYKIKYLQMLNLCFFFAYSFSIAYTHPISFYFILNEYLFITPYVWSFSVQYKFHCIH